jgi:DNA polymerase I
MAETQGTILITTQKFHTQVILDDLMGLEKVVFYPIINTNGVVIGLGAKDYFKVIRITDSKDIFDKFLTTYSGLVIFGNAKECFKYFKTHNLPFPAKFADLDLGAYLQESERKLDLFSLIESKYGVKLNYDLASIKVATTQSEDIFGEPEEILDLTGLDAVCRHYMLLAEEFLDTFTPQLTKLWLDIESPLTTVLAKMELAGVYINKQKLSETAADLTKQSKALEKEILSLLNTENINLNSSQQLADALQKKGFNLSKKGSSGKLSVDKFVLEELSSQDESGVIQKILEYRTLVKLLSTYTDNLISLLDSQSRLHCQFSQAQAATGRISSNSPNLQNIPIRNQEYGGIIRSCFAASEGRVMVSADYSQIELRLLAHFTGDPVLTEAFELNQDIHRRTAAEIFEIPLENVTKEQRGLGKTLNFALLYQQGSFATARQLGITVKEAKVFIDKYFASFATVKPFIESVLEKAREVGYTESLSGRRRYYKYLNSTNKMLAREDQRAAFNMVLQGSNADLIKIAMNQIDKKITEQKLDAIMMLQVHDELVFEVAEKDLVEVTDLVRNIMSNPPLKLNVPLLVDTASGPNWAEC